MGPTKKFCIHKFEFSCSFFYVVYSCYSIIVHVCHYALLTLKGGSMGDILGKNFQIWSDPKTPLWMPCQLSKTWLPHSRISQKNFTLKVQNVSSLLIFAHHCWNSAQHKILTWSFFVEHMMSNDETMLIFAQYSIF